MALNISYLSKCSIRINPPANLGIIIPAGYIVEPRLRIEVVAAVADRIELSDCGIAGCFREGSPGVVIVIRYDAPIRICNGRNIILSILDIEVLRAVMDKPEQVPGVIIHKDDNIFPRLLSCQDFSVIKILRCCSVYGLCSPLTVPVVRICYRVFAIRDLRQLPALPRKLPAAHRERVPDRIIRDCRAVIVREQVAPHAVPVLPGLCAQDFSQLAGCIGVLFSFRYIAV